MEVIGCTAEKHPRALWRNYLVPGHPMVDWLKQPENQVLIKPTITTRNPYTDMDMNYPQQVLESKLHNKLFERFQYIPISAPCASGKTMMGLQIIHYLRVPTLIISCRISIKEQWKAELKNKFGMNIKTNSLDLVPIRICSPQYLITKLNSIPQDICLVIYDEIHSMCGTEFAKILTINRYIKHPIYLCGLSATYPKDIDKITELFGKPIELPSKSIIARTVYVHDMMGTPNINWNGLSVETIIKRVWAGINDIPHITKCDKAHKFVCITETVADSIKCLQLLANNYLAANINASFVIMREATKGSYLISAGQLRGLKELTEQWILDNGTKVTDIDNSEAVGIFGCNARLKEGVNIRSLTYGICTNFHYSIPFRIQLLGRIRRTDEDIKRFFIVCPSKPPNNAKWWYGKMIKRPTKITYDFAYESSQYIKNGIMKV